MKPLRVWLVLLLAVLLPVRGAVAAAMLCPLSESGVQTELAMVGHTAAHDAMDHAMSHDHATPHDHGNVVHDHSTHSHLDQSGHADTDKCTVCSTFCSLTPLLSAVPTLADPLDPIAVKFCELAVPVPSFFSDGQERPPRTI